MEPHPSSPDFSYSVRVIPSLLFPMNEIECGDAYQMNSPVELSRHHRGMEPTPSRHVTRSPFVFAISETRRTPWLWEQGQLPIGPGFTTRTWAGRVTASVFWGPTSGTRHLPIAIFPSEITRRFWKSRVRPDRCGTTRVLPNLRTVSQSVIQHVGMKFFFRKF